MICLYIVTYSGNHPVSAYNKHVFVEGLTSKTVLIKLICILSISFPILLPHISQAYNNIGLIRVSNN